ncbi:hypothetical protein CRE_26840 [Caenorhabditis remanei]|uniref:Uncharacterized protein n=1 Tax=Caenorhabditis remanei TaxID=31234 RepID=E3NKK5_CAERE|nr:hypothetical protein CRE_26840 [Caenorhabditis remanei]
MREEKKERKRD